MLDVPSRVKKALFEKGWTQKKLCAEIDVTETGFKRMAENNTWKLDTIEKMAKALDKPIVYFVDEYEENSKQKDDLTSKGNFGANVLEELKALFEEEIRVKNQQIAGLQRTVDVLVGKSEGVTEMPTSPEYVSFLGSLDSYIYTVAKEHGFDPAMVLQNIPNFSAHSAQKLVAPRSQTVRTRR